MKSIRIIGLTGQTGAGKSTVSKTLSSRGITVIDCDLVAREVVDKEKELLADLAIEYGIGILNQDGTLNRRKLGSIVFADREKLDRLNEIIFPYITKNIVGKVNSLRKRGVPMVVLDAPTLFESGIDKECDDIISVIAPEELRLNRIMVRDHLSDTEARNRIASQHDDAFFIENSSHVIVNDKDVDHLYFESLRVAEELAASLDA
ncbi:MAG: dephospho-CoA kinase [Oscillospiraceae bacterium]|nr:dephospho-CoA kinase [Oscillospiraceae bacterium]